MAKKYEYFSQNLQRMPARGTVSRLQKLASSSICSSILERSWCFTLSVFFFFFFIVFVFSCVSICSSSSSFWTRAAYSCVEPPHKTNSKTHKKNPPVLHCNYNGEIGQKWDLVKNFDGGSCWQKVNLSELNFARPFQRHPTWPYLARSNTRPNTAKYAKYSIWARQIWSSGVSLKNLAKCSSDASTLSFCLPSMIFTIILVRFHSLVEADDVAAWAPHLNLLLAQHLQTNLYQVMMVMMVVIMMLWPSLGVGTPGWLFRVRKVAILAFTRKFTFSLILILNTQELVEQLLLRLDLAVSGIIINFWKDCEFSRIQLRHLFALPSGNLCLLSLDPRWDLKIFVCLKSDNKF